MSAPIPAAWADLTRAQQARLLSRRPLALACTVQGGRRWHARNGVLLDGTLRAPLASDVQYLGYLTIVVQQARRWSVETHDPESPMLHLVFDLTHEGTAAHLRWVVEGV